MSKNKIIVLGNVTNEPEIRTFDNGGSVANFTVATNEKGYTTKDGKTIPDRTEFHRVVMQGRLVNVAQQYIHKGDKVYIEGKMRYKDYTDANGVKKTIAQIYVEDLELCTRPQGQQSQQGQRSQQQAPPPQQQQAPPEDNIYSEMEDLVF